MPILSECYPVRVVNRILDFYHAFILYKKFSVLKKTTLGNRKRKSRLNEKQRGIKNNPLETEILSQTIKPILPIQG